VMCFCLQILEREVDQIIQIAFRIFFEREGGVDFYGFQVFGFEVVGGGGGFIVIFRFSI